MGSFSRPSIYLLPTATFNDTEEPVGSWKTYLKVLRQTVHSSRLSVLMRNRPKSKKLQDRRSECGLVWTPRIRHARRATISKHSALFARAPKDR